MAATEASRGEVADTLAGSTICLAARAESLGVPAREPQAPVLVGDLQLDGAAPLLGEEGLVGDRLVHHGAQPRLLRDDEGTDAPPAAMQAYLDWEFGLVAKALIEAALEIEAIEQVFEHFDVTPLASASPLPAITRLRVPCLVWWRDARTCCSNWRTA